MSARGEHVSGQGAQSARGAQRSRIVPLERGDRSRGSRGTSPTARLVRLVVYVGAGISTAFLLFILLYIFVMGIPHIRPELFAWNYDSVNVSLMPALINTVLMVLISLAIATPFGLFAAIYLVEYTKRGNRLVKFIRLMAETLAGIPSIIYGLFGMLLFVMTLGWGLSLLAGACTLAIMVLPVIMRTSEEALKAVPDSYREGSFGLGAGRLRTVFKVIVPSAMPGILAGVILGIGRVVGETAALIYTAGTVAEVPEGAFDSTRTLAVHMYVLASEGLHLNEAYATAVVLLAIVVIINTASAMLARRMTKGRQ
jgi:phosphate transport system permease protein